MPTLIERLENLTATQDDDYFSPGLKLDVLNQAKNHVVEVGIDIESAQRKSVRFLDNLRVTQRTDVLSPTQQPSFVLAWAEFPPNLKYLINLERGPQRFVELYDTYEIFHGNAIPNKTEAYFRVIDTNIELYLDDVYEYIDVNFISNYPEINPQSETSFLGHKAENAMLHYAAGLMTQTDTTLPSEGYFAIFNQFMNDLR